MDKCNDGDYDDDDCLLMLCNAVYIQANLEDDIVKEALKTVSQQHINDVNQYSYFRVN